MNPAVASCDQETLECVREGNAEAFEAIMRRYNQRLFRVARSIVKSDADAEEAVQNAYIQAYFHLDQFRGDSAFATWLTRIAVREACAVLRKTQREITGLDGYEAPEPMTSNLNPERAAIQSELRAVIERATDELPSDYRLVFVLREIEQLSTAETASCLGITEENVKVRLHRSRAMLRKRLYSATGEAMKQTYAFDGVRCDRIVWNVLAAIRGRGSFLA